ncbi:hypothetical protein KEM52_004445, partial [Ascosphaera acerosa]
TDTRIASVDVKLAALGSELAGYQARLAKMRDGPGKAALKQKALKVLQRKRQYEAQRAQLQQQAGRMEQADVLADSLKNVAATVSAMRTTTAALRQQYGRLDVAAIERMQDEMAELMEVGSAIQDSIGPAAYAVPDDVDEAELDAELEALGGEGPLGLSLGPGPESQHGVPAFLQEQGGPPAFIDEPVEPQQMEDAPGKKAEEAAAAAAAAGGHDHIRAAMHLPILRFCDSAQTTQEQDLLEGIVSS